MDEKLREACKKVVKLLLDMPREELLREIEKHKDGDFAKILLYAWNPESRETERSCSGTKKVSEG